MKTILISLLTLASTSALASDLSCRAYIINSEGVVLDQTFATPADAGGHGGLAISFKGQDDVLEIKADGKWMILEWSRKGETIASGTFVLANYSNEKRIAILTNPKNRDEQASLYCEPAQ